MQRDQSLRAIFTVQGGHALTGSPQACSASATSCWGTGLGDWAWELARTTGLGVGNSKTSSSETAIHGPPLPSTTYSSALHRHLEPRGTQRPNDFAMAWGRRWTSSISRVPRVYSRPMSRALLERITIEPGKCGGRPCLRGQRMRVSDLLELLANGASFEEILDDYPALEREDILAAIAYAAVQTSHAVVRVA